MYHPIPDLSHLRANKSSCRVYPIAPVLEPCIKVNFSFNCRSYYWNYDPRPEGAREEIFLRKTLAKKLLEINRKLRPLGLALLIQEGYRPLSVQRFVQEVSVIKGLRKENPSLGEKQIREMVKMFAASANGDVEFNPPPHLTGGAVDLTIIDADSWKQVDMGKSGGLYGTAFPDALEKREEAEFQEARCFRRLLFWLASEQGIAVNPTEWWHLSWGDQMWAWATKADCAIYGVAEHFK